MSPTEAFISKFPSKSVRVPLFEFAAIILTSWDWFFVFGFEDTFPFDVYILCISIKAQKQ